MSNDKRKFEYKESEEVETFFPIKKKKIYKKKGVQGWRGNRIPNLSPKTIEKCK